MADVKAKHETVLDPKSVTLAGVYAEGLLGVASDNSRAEEVAAELEALLTTLGGIEGAGQLLTSAQLSKDDRVEIVGKIFGGRVSEEVEGLLTVMARHGRLGLLSGVLRQFRKQLNTREGKVEVTVTTAVPLDEAQKNAIQAELGPSLGGQAMLTMNVDDRLLGGMRIKVGDRVYDASVAAYLQRLKKELISKAAAGDTETQRDREKRV